MQAGAPTAPVAAPPPAVNGGNMAVMQLRKALGLDPNQPAPEAKIIEAVMGRLGPDVKRMAEAIGGAAPGGAPTNGAPGGAPTTPDPGQAGGESAPPDPNGAPTGDAPNVQPGAGTDGKMGAATIFGKPPTGSIGTQQEGGALPPPVNEDEEDEKPGAAAMFARRR